MVIGSLDVITPTTTPDKGYIFKGEESIAYLLGFILDAYHLKVGFKSPNEVINLPYVPRSTIGWGLERATLWGGGCLF